MCNILWLIECPLSLILFATANAIQVGIDENIRLLAELHARWEREDEMAREIKVCVVVSSTDLP